MTPFRRGALQGVDVVMTTIRRIAEVRPIVFVRLGQSITPHSRYIPRTGFERDVDHAAVIEVRDARRHAPQILPAPVAELDIVVFRGHLCAAVCYTFCCTKCYTKRADRKFGAPSKRKKI